jgi:hypothetical protein
VKGEKEQAVVRLRSLTGRKVKEEAGRSLEVIREKKMVVSLEVLAESQTLVAKSVLILK